MAQELLKKIPSEKRWAITAKALTGFYVMIALKANELVLGKGEGVIAPISGWEMRKDISVKVLTLAAKRFYPWV